MSFKNLFNSLTSTSSRRRPSTARLCLEALEDRQVLSYSIVDLGAISAIDINNSGQVVGDTRTADGNPLASLWQDGVTIDLGTLGGIWSEARGINDAGQVVGLSSLSNATVHHAFLLTPEDTNRDGAPDRWFRDTNADGINDLMRDLGTLGGSDANSAADDVNNLGQVVGTSNWEALEGRTYRAFLWQNGVMTDPTTGAGQNSFASAINDAGVVTGGIHFGAQVYYAFHWRNGTLTILDGLEGAADINDAGQIVGSQYLLGRLWTPTVPNGTTGSYSDYLGALPPLTEDDLSYSFPAGMNNIGQIVGNSPAVGRGGGTFDRGFIYENGGMTELPLDNAMAINDAGQIVGNRGRGYLLTPVVPQTHISVSDASVVEGDSGATNAIFTVSLSTVCDEEVTFNYYAAEDSATVGADYEATYGTLHFAPGQANLTVSVPVIGDEISEPDENFYLSLYNPSINATIARPNGLGVIVNDDPSEIRIYDAAWQERNTGTSNVTFYIELSVASAEPVTVNYSTTNGSALAVGDYQAASGTVTFAAGETSKTIVVLVNGDRLPETDETFSVNLNSPTNATIADGLGVGTIVDDEPRISITDMSKSEGRKGRTTLFTFTVTVSAAYDQRATMSFKTTDGTAKTSESDYIAKTGTLTFAPGETTKTITVEVKGDGKREANETFYVDLFGLSSNALFNKSRGLGTILNDD